MFDHPILKIWIYCLAIGNTSLGALEESLRCLVSFSAMLCSYRATHFQLLVQTLVSPYAQIFLSLPSSECCVALTFCL